MSALVMKGLEGSTRVEIRLEFDPTSLHAEDVRQLAARAQRALTEILKQSSSQAGEADDREASGSVVEAAGVAPDAGWLPPPPVPHVDLATGGVVEPSSTFTVPSNGTVTQLPTTPRTFTDEQRIEALALADTVGGAEASRRLGIAEARISLWRHRFNSVDKSLVGKVVDPTKAERFDGRAGGPVAQKPKPDRNDIFPTYEPKKPFGDFMNKKFDPDQSRAAAAEALHANRIDL